MVANGNAQRPDKSKPSPTPTPAPTATPAPRPTPTPTPSCPLPDNYGVNKTVSPEKPLEAVCHNGKILCLPQSAAQAHIQHGDQDLGPCSKQGNNGPCP
ncbi:MAG: hypothetical protein DME34_06585 [Verrucomicrobia bacterium]|nr:MAG: hypothetical protein DME34_06585 [Verrucomicrobiota bacterium]